MQQKFKNLAASNKAFSSKNPNANEDAVPLPILGFQNHSFTVLENTKHNRIELHLRGEFPSPEQVADEISTLYQYSEEYNTLLIYINSPGGTLTTMTEILSATSKFDNIITVGGGQVASAGFTLWCVGDIRVLQPYTMVMAHRESYGTIGKTDQHIDHATHVNRIGARIIQDICSDVLTQEEIDRCKYTEVMFDDEELIERGACISWEQFVVNDTSPIEWNLYFDRDGISYHAIGESHVLFENPDDEEQYIVNTFDVIYDSPNPVMIKVTPEDEEQESADEEWVDPDDAPELDDNWFRNARQYDNGVLNTRIPTWDD